MRTEKEHDAMRVMEALSAVDQELLERSGKKASETGHKTGIRRFMQRYGAACAACLCLALLGAAYFGVSRMRMGSVSESSKSAGMNGGAGTEDMEADGSGMAEAGNGFQALDSEGAAPAEKSEDMAEADGQFCAEAPAEPEWLDTEGLGELARKDETENETGAVQQAPAAEQKHFDTAVGADIEAPEGYSPVETSPWDGGQGSLVYEWQDGEHSLWLRLTQTELTADMRLELDSLLCTVQEEWRELIPEAGADGYVQFALLYDNGMLAEYRGALEKEELVRLLESLEALGGD